MQQINKRVKVSYELTPSVGVSSGAVYGKVAFLPAVVL